MVMGKYILFRIYLIFIIDYYIWLEYIYEWKFMEIFGNDEIVVIFVVMCNNNESF